MLFLVKNFVNDTLSLVERRAVLSSFGEKSLHCFICVLQMKEKYDIAVVVSETWTRSSSTQLSNRLSQFGLKAI